MSRIIIIFLLSLSILFACHSKSDNEAKVHRVINSFDDDSTFQMYVPMSVFDSLVSEEVDFRKYKHGYYLKRNDRVSIVINYSVENYPYNFSNDITGIVMGERSEIDRFYKNKRIVLIDSIIEKERRIGLLGVIETNAMDTVYETTAYILSSKKNKWIFVKMSYDNSEDGRMLRDSLPEIIKSIYVVTSEL